PARRPCRVRLLVLIGQIVLGHGPILPSTGGRRWRPTLASPYGYEGRHGRRRRVAPHPRADPGGGRAGLCHAHLARPHVERRPAGPRATGCAIVRHGRRGPSRDVRQDGCSGGGGQRGRRPQDRRRRLPGTQRHRVHHPGAGRHVLEPRSHEPRGLQGPRRDAVGRGVDHRDPRRQRRAHGPRPHARAVPRELRSRPRPSAGGRRARTRAGRPRCQSAVPRSTAPRTVYRRKAGNAIAATTTPITTSTPPPDAATAVPTDAAATPCATSPTRGPPATTTMNTPWSRPRISSVAESSRIAWRNAAEIMSTAPPNASAASASHSHQADPSGVATPTTAPKTTMATPHSATHTSTARPCRRTRGIHPENTPPITAPTLIAANSRPSAVPPEAGSPKDSVAICGNSARGMPNTMAMMSTRNDASRIRRVAR